MKEKVKEGGTGLSRRIEKSLRKRLPDSLIRQMTINDVSCRICIFHRVCTSAPKKRKIIKS